MAQVWLQTNRRVFRAAQVALCLLTLVDLALVWATQAAGAFLALGVGLAVVGLLSVAGLELLARRPRLSYSAEQLLVSAHWWKQTAVPVMEVECFFLGQAPTVLPSRPLERTENRTVVVRLAERAAEWSHLPARRVLARWCDGYITLRGTWCEPLSIELVNKLNHQLAEVHRQQKGRPAEAKSKAPASADASRGDQAAAAPPGCATSCSAEIAR